MRRSKIMRKTQNRFHWRRFAYVSIACATVPLVVSVSHGNGTAENTRDVAVSEKTGHQDSLPRDSGTSPVDSQSILTARAEDSGLLRIDESTLLSAIATFVVMPGDRRSAEIEILRCANSLWPADETKGLHHKCEVFSSSVLGTRIIGRVYPSVLVSVTPSYRRYVILDRETGECSNRISSLHSLLTIDTVKSNEGESIFRAMFLNLVFGNDVPIVWAAVLVLPTDLAEAVAYIKEVTSGASDSDTLLEKYVSNCGVWSPGSKTQGVYPKEFLDMAAELIKPPEIRVSNGVTTASVSLLLYVPVPGKVYQLVRYTNVLVNGQIDDIATERLAAWAAPEELLQWAEETRGNGH